MAPVYLAALSGLLLTLSFPRLGHPAIAWVALVPLLYAICRTPWQARWLGLIAGVVHFAGAIYWIPSVMVDYGGLPFAAAWLVHVLLLLVLASFLGGFAWVMGELVRQRGPAALLLAPAVWVTAELGRIYLFTGFPWVLLGYSQVPVPAVAQAASVVGVLGLSTLVCAVSAVAAYVLVAGSAARRTPVVGLVLVLGLTVALGAWRLDRAELLTDGAPLRVAALQGNVSQDEKWDPLKGQDVLARYIRQTTSAAEAGAQLVIWPEAATQFPLAWDPRGEVVRAAARSTNTHLLVGTTDIDDGEEPRYYNAVFMIAPTGDTTAVYRKQHLVPFGEYVPLRRALFFVSPLVEAVGLFSAGEAAQALPAGDAVVATAICYEVIYPGLVRELTRTGANLLTTVTNDAWFGRSAAPYQHFEMARMRAIEHGRYLVRAANTGISGVVDPYGRVVRRSRIFEPAVVVDDVRLLTRSTIYTRIGDVVAYAGVGITIIALGAGRRRTSGQRRHNGGDSA